ncbi:unnamed protein product, partial [Didymodactylos carnosus]
TICAKYRIDVMRYDEFFKTVLHQTLSQLICDCRKKTRKTALPTTIVNAQNQIPPPQQTSTTVANPSTATVTTISDNSA